MTAAHLTLGETFIAGLGSAGIPMRITGTIAYNVARAVAEHGWTIPQLVTECTRDLDSAANVGAVITDRVRIAATVPPAKAKPKISRGVPFCSDECRANAGWILDANGRPAERCTCRTTS